MTCIQRLALACAALGIILPASRRADCQQLIPTADSLPELLRGRTVTRELAGRQIHNFRTALDSGGMVKVSVTQHGAELLVNIYGPRGGKVTKWDSSAVGPTQKALIVGRRKGNIRIEVVAKDAASGRFDIIVDTLTQEEAAKLAEAVRAAAATAAAAAPTSSQATVAVPTLWTVSGPGLADVDVAWDTTMRHSGRASIRLQADDYPAGVATVARTVAASGYAGHRVHLSIYLRSVALTGNGGVLTARAVDQSGKLLGQVNVQDSPVLGTTEWTARDLALDVPSNAAALVLGVSSSGSGALWMDDAQLAADGGPTPLKYDFENPSDFVPPPHLTPSPREAPRAISARGLANLRAFARALGYVRFFHPSDQTVRVNWDEFAVEGVRRVERAANAENLAATLRAFFAPIAPTVAFARTDAAKSPAVVPADGKTQVVYWRHFGVGAPSGGGPVGVNVATAYRSVRQSAPLTAMGTPVQPPQGWEFVAGSPQPRVPDPAQPIQVPLDGGVTITVPLALYTSETVIPDSMRMVHPARARERYSPSDRATRLADVVLAWSLFQQFYPYFDVVHTDWPLALTTALRSAATDRDVVELRSTLRRLVAALHDGHGNVIRATGPVATPDVHLGWAEGQIVVTAPGDSGAARGLRLGDVVLAIDGQHAAGVLANASTMVSGATQQWVRTQALANLLWGQPGSAVTLTVRNTDVTRRDVSLSRVAQRQANEKRPEKVAELSPGVMYVDLDRITDADFTAAMPHLQDARGIVFDMRGYPRQVDTEVILAHMTDTTIHSAHFRVPVLTMPDQREIGYVDGQWTITPLAPRLHARIAFLSGGGAISYAESTLGVVEAYRLADIVGEPSAGTNGNVNPFQLPGGYTVWWTGMRVVKRDGSPHHGVGILPTVPVSPTIAGIRAGRDEVLQAAVELVGARRPQN